MPAPSRYGLRLLVNVVGNFATRGVNLFTTFLTVPLAVAGLGTHDYAAFAVILSATTFVSYADFGLGLATVNPIAASEARGDHAETRRVISEAWGLLVLIAGAVLAAGGGVVALLAWTGLLAAAGVVPWFVFVACAAAGLPAALAQRVLFALQRNFEASLWVSAGRIASLGGVALAYLAEAGLGAYVLAMLGVPALFGWINAWWLFRRDRPELAPGFGASARTARRLLPEGLRYTVLQIGPYVETGFDIILVGLVLGAGLTTAYDLVTRAFNYVPALAAVGVLPLWPAIAAARARGDRQWARRVEIIATVLLCSAAAAVVTGLAVYYQEIIHAWTGQHVSFPPMMVALMALSAALSATAALLASILVGHQRTVAVFRVQVVVVIALAVTKVAVVEPLGIIALAAVNAFALLAKTICFLIVMARDAEGDRQEER